LTGSRRSCLPSSASEPVQRHATTGDEQADVAARLWARRWLRHEDIAVDAHHDLDVLA
jgi:hypothetical protein